MTKIFDGFRKLFDRSDIDPRISRPGGTLTMAENIGRMTTFTTRHIALSYKQHETNLPMLDFFLGDGISPVPQVVSVKTGDTYDTLAQNIYGTMADASAALAESSGDTAGVVPEVGNLVVTPQFIVNSNRSSDQMPMSRVQQYIQGTLLPHLEFAEPSQKKGKCSEVIVRVAIDMIAVAIAYFSCGTGSEISAALIAEGAVIAAASDAAMQEVTVNVALLQSFSWQEVITTGIAGAMAVGFSGPAGTGGVDGEGGVAAKFYPEFFSQFGTFARLIQLMVFAGTIDIMDQLALIAIGKQQGFDVKQLIVTIVEAGIAYGVSKPLNIANAPQLTRALNEVTDDIVDAFVGSAIMGGSAHIETAMAQSIGATIGNSIGDHVKVAHQSSTEVNSSEATHVGATKAFTNMGPSPDSSYYQAQAAAKGVGANASAAPMGDLDDMVLDAQNANAHDFAVSVVSNSNKPVTSVNQQNVLPSARASANAPSQSYTDQNPIFPYLLAPVPSVATAQSSMGNVWGMGNSRSTNTAQQPGFFNGLYQAEKQSYLSIQKWSAATIDSVSETAKTMGKGYYMLATSSAANAKNILHAPVLDSLAAESGSDVKQVMAKAAIILANSYKRYGNLLMKLPTYTKAGILSLDAIQKGIEVAYAPEGQKLRIGIVKGAEFTGEVLGAALVDASALTSAIPSGGVSLVVGAAATVGASAAGGYALGKLAELTEEGYDHLNNYIVNIGNN